MAAGGGGGNANGPTAFMNASLSTSGRPGFDHVGTQRSAGGENGEGATSNGSGPCAGNGGGYFTNGQEQLGCCSGTFGFAFLNGGNGGMSCAGYDTQGGFGGGGGGGDHGAGGGGGYSGGGASYHHPTCGGGGGSINLGMNSTGVVQNEGDGYIQIIRLFPPE